MAYIALYRKYRSQNFDELMGQDQVTTTLQNAIRTGRIAHAYLFHGARGCGKTSTARLLSRALNCVAQDGPTPNPCGVCRLCVSIRENTCMDVVEIDAASETGVDNVREKIIENVQYASSEARYKVYIIDEVHDLSAKAFDALLKTLEEPPPHVVFILATTEYHKVPITIRSRCQGYQFKRGSIHDLSAAVERVIKAENFTAEPEAIQAVARSAEGSWRDALSILEQVLAYSDGHITADIVHRALGTVGTEMLARVTETLARGAWDETLGIASDLVDSGTDVRQLLTALAGHLRDLMLLATGAKQAAAQELGADRLNLLKPQSNLFEPVTLLDMMGELSAAEREIRFSNQHRWILERTLCRLMMIGQGTYQDAAQPRSFARPHDVAAKVLPKATARQAASADVEDSGTTAAPYAPPTAPPVVPRPPTQQETQTFATRTNAPTSKGPMDDEDEDEEPDENALEVAADVPLAPPIAFSNLPSTLQTGAYVDTDPAPALTFSNGSNGNGTSGNTGSGSAGQFPPVSTPPDAGKHQFADSVTFDVLQRAWPRILKLVEKQSPSGASYLQKGNLSGLEGNTILISFKEAFARDRIQNKGKELVEKKINEGLKTEGYRIVCLLDGQNDGGVGAVVKTPVEPPSNDTGAAALMEMSALLDAPPASATPSGPSRVMDFEVHAAPPPARDTPRNVPSAAGASPGAPAGTPANGANGHAAAPKFSGSNNSSSTPAPDESAGMLKEVLDIFGGQVIHTENI